MELKITGNKNSQTELERILKMVTPSNEAHQKYLEEVNLFINGHNHYSSMLKGYTEAQGLPIKRLKIVSSQIFNRQYLVAYADTNWFKSIAPDCNAVATQSLNSLNLNSPPLAIVPESSSRLKNEIFLSVLEHEFVHVNQGILNNFPDTIDFSDKPLLALINYMLAEYQANLIQYCYFPKAYELVVKEGCTLSMPDWSILRGYSQALEKLVHAIYLGQISAPTVEEMLKTWPEQLSAGFKQIGLQESYALDYIEKLPQHLLIAVKPLIDLPQQPFNDGFKVLARWVSAKFKS